MCDKHKKWPKLYLLCVNIHVVFHDSSLDSLIHFSLLSCNYLRTILAHGPGSQHWKLKFDPLRTVHFIHLTEVVFLLLFYCLLKRNSSFCAYLGRADAPPVLSNTKFFQTSIPAAIADTQTNAFWHFSTEPIQCSDRENSGIGLSYRTLGGASAGRMSMIYFKASGDVEFYFIWLGLSTVSSAFGGAIKHRIWDFPLLL